MLIQFQEMFVIVEAVKAVIVFSHTTYTSTTQAAFQRVVLLATTVLEPKTPLSVTHVQLNGQKEYGIWATGSATPRC